MKKIESGDYEKNLEESEENIKTKKKRSLPNLINQIKNIFLAKEIWGIINVMFAKHKLVLYPLRI